MSNSSQLNIVNGDFTLTIAGDTILEFNNTRVFVNESSAQYINGMIVDWISGAGRDEVPGRGNAASSHLRASLR